MKSLPKLLTTLLLCVTSATLYLGFAVSHSTGGSLAASPIFIQDFPTPPQRITSALATVPPDAKGIPTHNKHEKHRGGASGACRCYAAG